MEELFMENRMIKLRAKGTNDVTLKVIPGHFATNHSHINYYIDITTLKTRLCDAEAVARELAQKYVTSTVIDTIVCLDGTQVIGACLARELTASGLASINAHQSIYVIRPEYNSNSQLLFRDNLQPMLNGKHVLILMASVATGKTINKSVECVQYYGGIVQGVAAVYSTMKSIDGLDIQSIFSPDDLPGYASYEFKDCPYCKQGIKLDALVNSFGYSKL